MVDQSMFSKDSKKRIDANRKFASPLTMAIDTDTIEAACKTLAHRDHALARAYAEIGVPEWRSAEADFEALARIVTYQLLSTKAAAKIWGRVLDWAGGKIRHTHVLTGDRERLRACGLSGPKVNHLISIADAIETDTLPLARLCEMSDDDARKALIAVKGIGPWTADVFLMGSLNRLNAFPLADVGLMEAFRILNEDNARLKPEEFQARAEDWAPYRAVAAHLLWGYINKIREKTY
jgi:DNA-3-methyladenine glycosylase II